MIAVCAFQLPRMLLTIILGVPLAKSYIFLIDPLQILVYHIIEGRGYNSPSLPCMSLNMSEPYLKQGRMYVIHTYVVFQVPNFFHFMIFISLNPLLIFFYMQSRCGQNESLLSIQTPRYLYSFTIGKPWINLRFFLLLPFVLCMIMPDFFLLMVMMFLSAQFSTILIAFFSF